MMRFLSAVTVEESSLSGTAGFLSAVLVEESSSVSGSDSVQSSLSSSDVAFGC